MNELSLKNLVIGILAKERRLENFDLKSEVPIPKLDGKPGRVDLVLTSKTEQVFVELKYLNIKFVRSIPPEHLNKDQRLLLFQEIKERREFLKAKTDEEVLNLTFQLNDSSHILRSKLAHISIISQPSLIVVTINNIINAGVLQLNEYKSNSKLQNFKFVLLVLGDRLFIQQVTPEKLKAIEDSKTYNGLINFNSNQSETIIHKIKFHYSQDQYQHSPSSSPQSNNQYIPQYLNQCSLSSNSSSSQCNSQFFPSNSTNEIFCIRCGRNSHFVNNCIARTHFDGTKI